ncbi:ScbR family autoregulator-binding transcription factor [Streptomyces venezuelae]|uniref:ScbR family autoregulator-binding transcription factor n=1 Tax=Streptomyces venezuelae TaxID=54571 RepID=UPI00168049F7|nr:ScbR family autoregulator-binding transcription factor [Streptomyces venezuelae]
MVQRTVKQDRALRTRAALIQAGAEVFGEQGFAGASVTRIAERAGMTLGAMYFHFPSKEALAREIVRSQPDLVSPPLPSEGLQHAVDVTLTWAYQLLTDALLFAGARLVMEQDHFIAREENSHRQWTALLTDDFRLAVKRRELRRSVDVEALARLIVNACTGAQMHSHMETGREDLPQRVEETWRLVLPAVAVPRAIEALQFGEERGRRL